MSSSPVGIINNHVQNLVALESEIALIEQYGKESDKKNYLLQLGNHFNKITKNPKTPNEYRKDISEIQQNLRQPYSEENFTTITNKYGKILKNLVGEGCYQNQIAVDMFKSSTLPDLDKIKADRLLAYRNVNAISEKKKWGIYQNNPIIPQGFTTQDVLADNANRYWDESKLPTRPYAESGNLFLKSEVGSPEFEKYAKYKLKIAYGKAEYDKIYQIASMHSIKERNEKGATLKLSDRNGQSIDITNLAYINHPEAYKQEPLEVRLIPNRGEKNPIHNSYHQLIAQAKVGEEWQNLGTVCELSRRELNLQPSIIPTVSAELNNPIVLSSEYYQQSKDYSKQFHDSIPPEDLDIATAAAWEIASKREVNRSQKSEVRSQKSEVRRNFCL
jgi:hypothetical protein